jgi:hypothetical protein
VAELEPLMLALDVVTQDPRMLRQLVRHNVMSMTTFVASHF